MRHPFRRPQLEAGFIDGQLWFATLDVVMQTAESVTQRFGNRLSKALIGGQAPIRIGGNQGGPAGITTSGVQAMAQDKRAESVSFKAQ